MHECTFKNAFSCRFISYSLHSFCYCFKCVQLYVFQCIFHPFSINSPSFILLLLPFLRYFLSINCKKFLTPTIFHHFSDPHQGSALDLLVGSQCPSRPPAELRHLWHLKKSLAFQLNSILLLKTVAAFFPEINPVQAN